MRDALFTYEPLIRLGVFAGVFVLMAAWEVLTPRRPQTVARNWRWPNNLGVLAVDVLLVRVGLPVTTVSLALVAEAHGVGLFNMITLPAWASIIVSVILLDLAIYLQHVLFHAVPALWRLHRMHHADLDLDVTTGARFHPIEILASMVVKMAAITAVGATAEAVLAFEILLSTTSIFNHANVRIPVPCDRLLRWIVVTPDMHRVHHSVVPQETNSNFGFNMPWWDRLFGTYRAQPAAGHEAMTIGIRQFRAPREQWLDRMLTQPFREDAAEYPM